MADVSFRYLSISDHLSDGEAREKRLGSFVEQIRSLFGPQAASRVQAHLQEVAWSEQDLSRESLIGVATAVLEKFLDEQFQAMSRFEEVAIDVEPGRPPFFPPGRGVAFPTNASKGQVGS
jgi:hypothetical protein